MDSRGGPSARLRLTAAALLLSWACTPSDDPSPVLVTKALNDFLEAWNARDEKTMVRMLARPLSPERVARILGRVDGGLVESLEVEKTGAISLAGRRATATYTVTYVSKASSRPVSLHGALTLVRDERDAWRVEWSRSHMWPGIAGAVGLGVRTRPPPRGRILDRKARVLARGSTKRRRYPFGTLAGSVIGHVGRTGGSSGVEEAYDAMLSGRAKMKLVAEDKRGRVLRVLGARRGRPGRSVRLTLDVSVQRVTERALASTVGGAVVLDPRSGHVLATVGSGAFDPNNYVGSSGIQPFNRALFGLYPPGSALKVLTATAALDSKKVTTATKVTGPAEWRGVRNFESGEFGSIDFPTALHFSVNTAFAQVARKLGPRLLYRYANRFGFNRPPKTVGAATPRFPFPRDEGDLLWSAIGQAQVLATPLQMAAIAATVANDGVRVEPRLSFSEDKVEERVMSRRTARILTTLMEGVVRGGTGTAAQISGVRVAGKTGTAEVDVAGERRNHAWFISFAPTGRPRVAVGVVSEFGGVGGEVAAPLARAILQGALPLTR